MNEPKDIAPDLPEEDEPFDAPPAPAADPLDDGEPDLPEPEPEPEPEAPVEDVAPARPLPVDDHADLFADAPEPVPEPEPEPEPVTVEAEPDAVEPAALEPDTVETAAQHVEIEPIADLEDQEPEPAAIVDPLDDLHGPEPWEQAPATPAPPAPELRLVEPEAPVADPVPAPARGPAAPRPEELTYEAKRSAFAVYLCYLTALMGVGLPLLPFACWWAYQRRREAPEWLQSHYTFQIRTFWIVLGGIGLAGLVLFLPFALFPLTIVGLAIWLVARCFVGMVRLHRGEPIFHPQTWTV